MSTTKAPVEKHEEPKAPEADAEVVSLQKRYGQQDKFLKKLYDKLVVKIKEAAEEGDNTESTNVMRAGAVDFLNAARDCLQRGEELNAATKNLISAAGIECKKVDASKLDLQRRSDKFTVLVERNSRIVSQLKDLKLDADKALAQASK